MTITTRTSCAVLVPYGLEFDNVRHVLEHILGDLDVQVIDAGRAGLPGSSIYETILQVIVKTDLVIADITGGNPNIMYEVGFAHALKKPVLLIVRSGADTVPADLRGELFFIYSSDQVGGDKNLEFAVRTWIERHILAMQSR